MKERAWRAQVVSVQPCTLAAAHTKSSTSRQPARPRPLLLCLGPHTSSAPRTKPAHRLIAAHGVRHGGGLGIGLDLDTLLGHKGLDGCGRRDVRHPADVCRPGGDGDAVNLGLQDRSGLGELGVRRVARTELQGLGEPGVKGVQEVMTIL